MSDAKGLPGKPFTGRLTREDLRYARRHSLRACVLARLLRRVVPDAAEVNVWRGHMAVRYPRSWRWHHWAHDAADVVDAFDAGGGGAAWVGRRVRFRPITDEKGF